MKTQPCGHPMSAIVSSDEGTHYCGECALEARLGPPFVRYDDNGDKVQDPDLDCQVCSLFGTEDCTKDNCMDMLDGHEPVHHSEDRDDLCY